MTALDIIERLGGVTALSKNLGVPLTTVSSWGRSNHIPEWRQPAVMRLALEYGASIATTDFPPVTERVRLGKAA